MRATQFGILGGLEVSVDGTPAELPRGRPLAILAALLAEPNRIVATDDLIEALWGETPPRTADNTLQVHVATLRRALRVAGEEVSDRLAGERLGYRLRIDPGELDAEAFAVSLGDARRLAASAPLAAVEGLRNARSLWRGPAFEAVDLRTPGVEAAIARLEEARLEAIELEAELELRLGRATEVIDDLAPVVREHPFRERLQALRMLALYRAGRQADALEAYQRARHALVEELGVEPGPELRALELAVLQHDPTLLAGPPPGPVAAAREAAMAPAAGGAEVLLPRVSTPFIGRDREVAELVERLPRERLVTVAGVGGAGKTRFAIHAAALVAEAFPAGVRFLDLGATTDAERLALALAGLYGVAEQPGRETLDVVAAAVATGRRLLVLDTCEHLVGHVGDAATRLLDAAAGLTILATSREPLHLPAELVWHLAPLGATTPLSSAEAARADDGVRLFMGRAGRLRPNRTWSDADLLTIQSICHRLDGLPLAIEMAASRSMVLSPRDIDDRLSDRFALLAAGDRGGAVRHRTLRATFDWSYELLEPAEQATLRRLSLFALPALPAAVEEVCGGEGVPDPMAAAIRLAERSLVVAAIDADGRTRFDLLDTVREYGEGRLRDAGESGPATRRYVEHWTAFAADAYARRIDEPDDCAAALEAAWDELRASVDRARALDPVAELHLTGLLGWFWVHHTHIAEGRRFLDRALAIPGGDDRDRARALTARAGIASAQGDVAVAEADGTAAVATWRRLGDRLEEAGALDALGWARFWAGNDRQSLEAFEASVAVADEQAVPGLVRRTRAGLCQVVVAMGDVARARPLAEDLARLASGDLWAAHLAVHYLADCALMEGDPAAALGRYREALVLANRMANRTETSIEIEGIAMSLAGMDRRAEAVRLYAAAEAELERLGVQLGVPFWNDLRMRYLDPAIASLGTAAHEQQAAGRALSFEDAVAFSAASAPVAIV